uniref:Uncharacterized protein n=1 Tax=Meloidogyne hapla TaxID=6305 RepID=A0A1I8B476_MELHA
MDILTDGARFPYVHLISEVRPSLLILIKNFLKTSNNCSSISSHITFQVDGWGQVWNFNQLHDGEGVTTKEFIHYGRIEYRSKYKIYNDHNPDLWYLVSYLWVDNAYRAIKFTIQ